MVPDLSDMTLLDSGISVFVPARNHLSEESQVVLRSPVPSFAECWESWGRLDLRGQRQRHLMDLTMPDSAPTLG